MYINEEKFKEKKVELFNLFDLIKNPIIHECWRDLDSYLGQIVELIQDMED